MRRLPALAVAVALVCSLSGCDLLSPRDTPTPGLVTRTAQETPLSAMCADYQGGTITVEVLGDSIMWGTGANTEQATWRDRLRRALGPSASVWNGALPGSVASDYLPGGRYYNHTQFARAAHPSVITVDWRINEQYQWEWNGPGGVPPEGLTAHVVAVARHVREASPDTMVVVVNPPRVGEGWNQAGQDRYVEALREARVQLGSAALWLDLDRINDDPGGLGLKHPDRIHVAEAGQAVQAEAFRNLIHGACSGVGGVGTP